MQRGNVFAREWVCVSPFGVLGIWSGFVGKMVPIENPLTIQMRIKKVVNIQLVLGLKVLHVRQPEAGSV